MAIIIGGNKIIEQRLLSEVDDEVAEILDLLEEKNIKNFIPQLTIINALHPTIAIRKKVSKLLELELSKEEIKQNKMHLHFLQLITDEAEETIDETFLEAFRQYNPHRKVYEHYILKSNLYASIYIEAADLMLYRKINVQIAQSLMESYLSSYENDEVANILLARIFRSKSQFDDSLELLEKVIANHPNSFQGHLEIGFALEEYEKNYEEAIKHYKLAAAINSDEIIVYVRLAYVNYFFLENMEDSKLYIDSILNIDPHNQYALTILGRIHWEVHNKQTLALNTFLKGLTSSKFHHSFLLGTLAEFYIIALGDLHKGKIFYEQALDIEPENRTYLVHYIQLLRQFYNDYGRMKHYYEQYLKQVPADIEIQMEFCLLILNYINDTKLARKQLKKVLALQPGHLIAKALYDEISD